MRSNQYTIVFANGETLVIPAIFESGPGWVMKPDEARSSEDIRRGTNKSFGRGSEADRDARDWLTKYIEKWMINNNWPKPVSMNPETFHYYLLHEGGMNVTFKELGGIGFDQLAVVLRENYRSENWTLNVTWYAAAIQKWHRTRMITDTIHPNEMVKMAEQVVPYQSRKHGTKMIEQFAKAPIETAHRILGPDMAKFPYTELDLPPLEWTNSTEPKWLDDAQTVSIYNDEDHRFYRDDTFARKIYSDSYNDWGKLQKAFEHLGVEFRVNLSYTRDMVDGKRKRFVEGVTIAVPADKTDEHNREGHKVEITTEGASIVCGYRDNEEKWQEYMKRQAADWLQEMSIPTNPTYEDYEYKPGE